METVGMGTSRGGVEMGSMVLKSLLAENFRKPSPLGDKIPGEGLAIA